MVESTVESGTGVVFESVEEALIRVLHVDDEAGFLKAAKQCLEMQGAFQVETALSVEEAAEKMKEKTYDVIVSDYKMPEKDGLAFLKELRDNGNDTPFIMFTGKGREEIAVKALNLGADLYFNKIGDAETVYGELAHGIRKSVERKKAYLRAFQRKERLRAIFASSPDAIIISDLQGNVVDCSESTLKLTEYRSKEEIIGRSSLEFIAEKDRNRALENLKKTLEQGATKNMEYALLKKDGRKYTGELSASILKDVSGTPIGFVGVLRDITERKKAEEMLKRSEKDWRNSFNALEEIMLIVNKDYIVERINNAGLRLLGKTREEVIGKKCHKVIYNANAPMEFCPCKKTFKTGKVESVDRYYKKFNKYFVIKSFPIRNEQGEIVNFVDLMRDITERKKNEEVLRKSEEKYRNIVELAPDCIMTFDLKGVITSCNTASTKLSGYSKDELVGKHFSKIGPIRARDIPKFLKMFPYTVRGKVPKPFEITFKHKDGSTRHGEVRMSLMKVDGKTIGLQAIMRDITKRKAMKESIRESEEKFRNIFENASDAMIYLRKSGRIVDVNKKAVEVFGGSREEILEKHFTRLGVFSIKDTPLLMKNFADILTGKTVTTNITVKNKKDQNIPLECSASLLKTDSETMIMVVARDITERKKAEQTLKESEQKWRSLVELAPDGIVTVDLKGVITSVNPAFLKFTGYTKEDIVGKHFTKLRTIRARDIPKYLKMMSSTLRGKIPPPFEYSYIRKDGTTRWAEGHFGQLKRSGKLIGFQGILRETTGRKLAEKTARDSQAKFERLFMGNPEAAVYVDSDYRVLTVNPRFSELFGYTLDEVEGRRINDVVVPEDKMEEAEALDEMSKEKTVRHDTVRKRKDGSLVPVSVAASKITAEGKFKGYVAIYTDISQLKNTENQIKEALQKLEIANEKLGVVGKLTRHDVRNKLSAVTGNLYLAKQKLPENHEAFENINEIESAVKATEKILNFAKTYEKLGAEELTYIDIRKTFEEVATLFPNLHGLKVVNDCHGLKVLADSLLKQLFYNLIDNSLKHGQKTSQIRLHYKEADEDELKLIYEDNGIGIPKAEKEKVFTEGYGKDTGHGLYLMRKICQTYGWTIHETGKQDRGARFIITIPKQAKTKNP